MNLTKYIKLSTYEVKKVLDDYIGLTDEQKTKLTYIDRFPFTIIKYEVPSSVNTIWRITILFYLLFMLITLLVMPIKWMLTGDRYFSNKSWHYKVYIYWSKKLRL